MFGLLVWEESVEGVRKRKLQETSVLRMRVMKAGILKMKHTPERVLHRRIFQAAKRLHKHGVTQIVLPEGIVHAELPQGVQAVNTLYLRQTLAADWVRKELEKKGIRTADAEVAVVAERLTGEVVRTVTELSLRHRYVRLEVPYGGEELSWRLRKEYGVSLLVESGKKQLEHAEVLVLFHARPDLTGGNAVVIPLFADDFAMPPLLLPPALEEKLPLGVNREQLLAMLLQAGLLRPGVDLTF